jgi:hypothetical protein
MRRLMILLFSVALLFGSCGPKPQYKSREGKKKLKHYNKRQFGDREKYKKMKK